MTKSNRLLALMLLSVLGSACGEEVVCTLEPRPGIRLEIRDSITNAPVAAGAIAVAIDGAYVDSVTVTDAVYALLTWNRGGFYTVRVRKADYMLWQKSSVFVPGGECGAERSVEVVARIQPE